MQGSCDKSGWSKMTQDNCIEMIKGFDDNTICWATAENIIRIRGKVTLTKVLMFIG